MFCGSSSHGQAATHGDVIELHRNYKRINLAGRRENVSISVIRRDSRGGIKEMT
jgi:hypothetical protein